MGQLATTVGNMQNKGKFPSTTEPNPKEHCKAIELRSGTKYQGPPLPNEHDEEKEEEEIEQEVEDDKVEEIEEDEGLFGRSDKLLIIFLSSFIGCLVAQIFLPNSP
ncbi:hypothetical protein ACS0TY_013804 [Phlomoides rotata]